MPVIINDIKETTGSSVILNIDAGRHDRMILGLTSVWDDLGIPSRGIPSGGGGTWIAIDSQSATLETSNVYIYAWYSYPTIIGSISINAGSVSGELRHSVFYSLSNAQYKGYSSHGESYSRYSAPTIQSLNKQGGRIFGIAGALSDSLLGIAPYLGVTFDHSNIFEETGGLGGVVYTYNKKHDGVYVDPYREQGGIDWGRSEYCSHIQIAVDTIECAL